jgi:hypothetical protein
MVDQREKMMDGHLVGQMVAAKAGKMDMPLVETKEVQLVQRMGQWTVKMKVETTVATTAVKKVARME